MSVIITTSGNIGPFKSIETLTDRLRADGTDYPFTVIGEYTLSEDDGLAPVLPVDIIALCCDRCEEVNTLREQKISVGVPYIFPDTTTGTVQTRDMEDARNLLVLDGIAKTLVINGQPDYQMPDFRDQEDNNHLVTASQMIAMAAYVGQVGGNIYHQSHVHKDALRAIRDGAGSNAEKAAAILAYDITQGWPV